MSVQRFSSRLTRLDRSFLAAQPEALLEGLAGAKVQTRFQRLYNFLCSGKLEVRVLPDDVFGLIHGKAGGITLADGSKTSFMSSANESKSA